jgi:hypothetical protein
MVMQNKSQYRIPLNNGYLDLFVEPSEYLMGTLLDFASRENPNRAYLFLSKVLGKYIPCLPSDMRKSYKALANKITVTGDSLVLGVAETATGLGGGVFEEIDINCSGNAFYAHTTRYSFDKPLAFSVTEKHSHAPQHLMYDLAANLDLTSIENLILVDDEISTGNTLSQITQTMCLYLPNLKTAHWLSLVNWISKKECVCFRDANPSISLNFHSLLRGGFKYRRSSEESLRFPHLSAVDLNSAACRHDIGRTGVKLETLKKLVFVNENSTEFAPENLNINEKYIVVGTGEFTFAPFLFAEKLERDGYDVLFESTGRSPILKGGGILSKIKFYDPVHRAYYYLYNLPENRTPIIMYENMEQFRSCPLHKLLNCKVAILGIN